ncbi:fatty acid desaturase family protein [Roseivirga sp.]|uniref:fatty acid desaturase family protein n=1 Tax=Roseivirga sp. TaxID=1964215 RepID=UPI003B52B5D4
MALKSLVMVSLFVIPLVIISLGLLNSGWQLFVAYLVCGLGMAGIGMGVMHDAIHGSYSNSPKLNRLMAQTMNLVGANASVWRVQHNVLHHTYTNIEGADDDLNTPTFLRFTPDRILKNVHRYQHWYTWFFYALSTISWITSKDFVRLKRYADKGLIRKGKEYNLLLTKLIAWKAAYYTYALILPVLFSGFGWGMVLLAFLSMHVVTGISISLVFQTAHIMPETNFPSPCPKGDMNCNWTVHQLETTTNYAPDSKLFSWFIGGLNYQVEHHLFPHICHLHYPRIAKIVKRTTEEFGLTYHSIPTFEGALKEHARMLKELGRQKKLQFANSEL